MLLKKEAIFACFCAKLLVMDPSLDSARFDSVLTRVFKEKARLGSARSLSLKTRSMEKGPKRVDLSSTGFEEAGVSFKSMFLIMNTLFVFLSIIPTNLF